MAYYHHFQFGQSFLDNVMSCLTDVKDEVQRIQVSSYTISGDSARIAFRFGSIGNPNYSAISDEELFRVYEVLQRFFAIKYAKLVASENRLGVIVAAPPKSYAEQLMAKLEQAPIPDIPSPLPLPHVCAPGSPDAYHVPLPSPDQPGVLANHHGDTDSESQDSQDSDLKTRDSPDLDSDSDDGEVTGLVQQANKRRMLGRPVPAAGFSRAAIDIVDSDDESESAVMASGRKMSGCRYTPRDQISSSRLRRQVAPGAPRKPNALPRPGMIPVLAPLASPLAAPPTGPRHKF